MDLFTSDYKQEYNTVSSSGCCQSLCFTTQTKGVSAHLLKWRLAAMILQRVGVSLTTWQK